MSERVGPFMVPDERGGISLIYDYERVPLDHTTCEHFWRVFTEYMIRWAEEQRKKNG